MAIRFRPLFEGEDRAAQWKVSLLKNQSKEGKGQHNQGASAPDELHQVKLLDKIQTPGINVQNHNQFSSVGAGDPFLKLLGSGSLGSSPQKQ